MGQGRGGSCAHTGGMTAGVEKREQIALDEQKYFNPKR
jgi:hypothetical protein